MYPNKWRRYRRHNRKAVNTIAENIYNMVNDKGKSEIIFDGIIGHKKNRNAVSKVDRYVTVNDKKSP